MSSPLRSLSQIPFVRDVLTLQVGRFVTIACGMATSILYARLLGLSGYGEYAVIVSFVGIFSLVTNLGQQATLLTFFAEAYGRKDTEGMTSISRYYACISVITMVILLGAAALAPTVTTWIYQSPRIGELGRILFFSSVFEVVFSYYAIALQVTREIKALTFMENAKVVLQVLLAFVFLLNDWGPAGILTSQFLASIFFALVTLARYPLLQKTYNLPHAKDILSGWNPRNFSGFLRDGIFIAVDKSVGNQYPNIFLFVLSLVTPQSVVGLLRLAFKLADLPSSFGLSSISRMASSVLSTLSGSNKARLRASTLRLITYTVTLHSLLTLGAIAGVYLFIDDVYGANFRVAFYPFLVIVLLQLAYGVTTHATPILRIHSKIYMATIINVLAMSIGIGAFFLLQGALVPTQALYVGLCLFHIISVLQVIPALSLMNSSASHAHSATQ